MESQLVAAKQFLEEVYYIVTKPKKDPLAHALDVVKILREEFKINDLDVLSAGMVQDVLEDTHATPHDLQRALTPRAVSLVVEVSHPHDAVYDREEYYRRLKTISNDGKWIKLADVLSNLRWMIASARAKQPVFMDHGPYLRHVRSFLAACDENIFDGTVNDVASVCAELDLLDVERRKRERD